MHNPDERNKISINSQELVSLTSKLDLCSPEEGGGCGRMRAQRKQRIPTPLEMDMTIYTHRSGSATNMPF